MWSIKLNLKSKQNSSLFRGKKKNQPKPKETKKPNLCVQNDDLETLIYASSLYFPKELL